MSRMCDCWICVNSKAVTPPGCKSFEEFVDYTTVECTLGLETGKGYRKHFKEVELEDEKNIKGGTEQNEKEGIFKR